MHGLDLIAALALAAGAFLGARRGFWKMAAGGAAVSLGAAAGWALSETLAAALRDWGVGPPGDVVLGFFLPFALVSVYARFIMGLWLSRRLEGRPGRNRLLGAAAGVAWVVLAAGLAARAAGLGEEASISGGPARATGPFTSWLARYPGALSARIYLGGVAGERPGDAKRLHLAKTAVQEALDGARARERVSRADDEAFASIKGRIAPPLRVRLYEQPQMNTDEHGLER